MRAHRAVDTAGTVILAAVVASWIGYLATGADGFLAPFFTLAAAGIALEPLVRRRERTKRRNHPSLRQDTPRP